MKVVPSTTSVWPALWPPWKRTTTSARSDSQSTIFPLPSSPHCEPTTTTFAMSEFLSDARLSFRDLVSAKCRASDFRVRPSACASRLRIRPHLMIALALALKYAAAFIAAEFAVKSVTISRDRAPTL